MPQQPSQQASKQADKLQRVDTPDPWPTIPWHAPPMGPLRRVSSVSTSALASVSGLHRLGQLQCSSFLAEGKVKDGSRSRAAACLNQFKSTMARDTHMASTICWGKREVKAQQLTPLNIRRQMGEPRVVGKMGWMDGMANAWPCNARVSQTTQVTQRQQINRARSFHCHRPTVIRPHTVTSTWIV